jgi:dihydrofolate reductase
MNCIVAVDRNWAIGNKNELLISIPSDQKYFRELTTGNVVILGRKTLAGFPGGRPLKNRVNIMLTKSEDVSVEGATVVNSVEDAIEEAKKYPEAEIFVIGGESVYRQFLPYCDKAYVTFIDREFAADTYFPNLEEDDEWEMTEESDEMTYFDSPFTFRVYERIK